MRKLRLDQGSKHLKAGIETQAYLLKLPYHLPTQYERCQVELPPGEYQQIETRKRTRENQRETRENTCSELQSPDMI